MPGKNECFDLWQAHGSIHLPVYLRSNNFVLFQTLTLWKLLCIPGKNLKEEVSTSENKKITQTTKKNCSPSQIVFHRCSALYVHLLIYYGITLQRQHQGAVPQKSWHKRIGRQLKNTNADLRVTLIFQ